MGFNHYRTSHPNISVNVWKYNENKINVTVSSRRILLRGVTGHFTESTHSVN